MLNFSFSPVPPYSLVPLSRVCDITLSDSPSWKKSDFPHFFFFPGFLFPYKVTSLCHATLQTLPD